MAILTVQSTVHGTQRIIFDDEDMIFLAGYTWYVVKRHETFYAVAHAKKANGKETVVYMHRLLLTTHQYIDHINSNGLNNRRENLRAATRQQNGRNRRKRIHATSQYKGVHWNRQEKRWKAQITLSGKNIHLGGFREEKDAAQAYDVAAKHYYGIYAQTNF